MLLFTRCEYKYPVLVLWDFTVLDGVSKTRLNNVRDNFCAMWNVEYWSALCIVLQ